MGRRGEEGEALTDLRAQKHNLKCVWDLAKKIQVRKDAQGWGVQEKGALGRDRFVSSAGPSDFAASSAGTRARVRGSGSAFSTLI